MLCENKTHGIFLMFTIRRLVTNEAKKQACARHRSHGSKK